MPLFPSNNDISIFRRWNNEVFNIGFTEKKFFKLRKDLTVVDDLYQEAQNPVFDGPYLIRAYVELTPQMRTLDKFGLDERRDLLVYLSRDQMDALDLRPGIGDVIVLFDDEDLDRREYEVLEVHHEDYYGNTGNPMHWKLTCNTRYQSSVDDKRVDVVINVPPPPEEDYP